MATPRKASTMAELLARHRPLDEEDLDDMDEHDMDERHFTAEEQLAQVLQHPPVPPDEVLPQGRAGLVVVQEPPVFDPVAQLQQLQQLTQAYVQMGLVAQRPDGSYFIPGQQPAPPQRQNSSCGCAHCTPHNQRHWICMTCGSMHEWVMVNDRPITMRQTLGVAGKAGFVHLCCSNACALGYKQQYQGGQMQTPMVGVDRPYPVAGGEDGFGFFLNQGAA